MQAELNKKVVDELGGAIRRIAILGTGLIGASIGLALRQAGYSGSIFGWDEDAAMLQQARSVGAIDPVIAAEAEEDPFVCALAADVIVVAVPVLAAAEWLEQLAPVLSATQMVTDVASVKGFLVERVGALYNQPGKAAWLPGHPMAGKELGGAAYAEAELFRDTAWLFTGASVGTGDTLPEHPYRQEWVEWVEKFGARVGTLSPERHDTVCASVSHLPQMVASALSALLQQQVNGHAGQDGQAGVIHGIGGRALREMTRLGASPYSMWRDIAMTNEKALAAALLQMEQELTHLRENLRTAELRTIFSDANTFRASLIPVQKPSK